MKISELSGSAAKAFMVIRRMIGEGSQAMITASSVAREAGLSRQTAGKALAELEDIGAIRTIDREGYARLIVIEASDVA